MTAFLFFILLHIICCVSFCHDEVDRVRLTYVNSENTPVFPLPNVTILYGGYASQILSNMVAKILIEEKLGLTATHWPTSNGTDFSPVLLQYQQSINESSFVGAQFYALSHSILHVNIEAREPEANSLNKLAWDRYIFGIGESIDAVGGLGMTVQSGWYFPTYLLTDYPDLYTSDSLYDPQIQGLFTEIGRAVQQECRDRSRMPSSA
eukprot:TRINITY_DN37165_c0_g1_i2.p1 TRINITY_DN37165_c0_g1~~TRINITY_DN37165_c0_g1_i2.p1  ORF type:complete len:207 (+),score=17.00 TRINITY_DN37165_c0_g1_i2:45-665(+)